MKQWFNWKKLLRENVKVVEDHHPIKTIAKVIPVDVPAKKGLDRAFFFSEIKKQKLFTSLAQSQINGLNFILDGWEKSGYTDLRWLAYMLATTYHETARTMLPIAEYGKGRGRPYGKKLKMSRIAYTTPNHIYYGRGYVQLTWYENYEKMGKLLNVDLLNNPELAMDPKIAMQIMLEGMTLGLSSRGDFTGKALEHYFNNTIEDWNNARKIINGNDKKVTIGNYGKKFMKGLRIV
jgi:putative chitinase